MSCAAPRGLRISVRSRLSLFVVASLTACTQSPDQTALTTIGSTTQSSSEAETAAEASTSNESAATNGDGDGDGDAGESQGESQSASEAGDGDGDSDSSVGSSGDGDGDSSGDGDGDSSGDGDGDADLDPQLDVPPGSNAACTTPGSLSECGPLEICRFYSTTEGRCESCDNCGNLGASCSEGTDCDILFSCYQGTCRNICPLGTTYCGAPSDCLDVGHPSHGVCAP